MIGRIYDKVFVPDMGKTGGADDALNEKLVLLAEGADLETMDKAGLMELICKGAVIGEREGFISGVRYVARLLCDMLS